jgi:hypothetical protein
VKPILTKYSVPILSLLLILSNFSYATNIMMCGMMSGGKTSSCCNQKPDYGKGVSISKVIKSCCDSRTIELSNSNNLVNIKNDVSSNLKFFDLRCPGITPDISQSYILSTPSPKQKIPPDIPILVSSFLI